MATMKRRLKGYALYALYESVQHPRGEIVGTYFSFRLAEKARRRRPDGDYYMVAPAKGREVGDQIWI